MVAVRTAVFFIGRWLQQATHRGWWSETNSETASLSTETVQSAALSLEGIDDVHGGHGLPLGVFGVGDGITDDVLQEYFQDTAGLFVDQAGNTLDTTTASQTADGGLGDTLDVITQHLAMTLGATLSESFSSFATSRHCQSARVNDPMMATWQKQPVFIVIEPASSDA